MAELEDEQLQERLAGAERVPIHSPVSNRVAAPRRESALIVLDARNYLTERSNVLSSDSEHVTEDEDEETMLRQLQAEMAS